MDTNPPAVVLAEISQLIKQLPPPQRAVVRHHINMLTRYVDAGGPLAHMAFAYVGAKLTADADAEQQEEASDNGHP